jgi:hypothetical protein
MTQKTPDYNIALKGEETHFYETSRLRMPSEQLGIHYLVTLEAPLLDGIRVLVRKTNNAGEGWVTSAVTKKLGYLLTSQGLPLPKAVQHLDADVAAFEVRQRLASTPNGAEAVARRILGDFGALRQVEWQLYGNGLRYLKPVNPTPKWRAVVRACVIPFVRLDLKVKDEVGGLPFSLHLNNSGHIRIEESVLGFIRWADRNKVRIQD